MIFFIILKWLTCAYAFKVNRFCVDCKYYLPNYENVKNNKEVFGKCALFPKIDTQLNKTEFNKYDYLVSGENFQPDIEYNECKTVRQEETMCGEKGKYYKNKYTYFNERFGIDIFKKIYRCNLNKKIE